MSGLEELLQALGTRKGEPKNIYLLFCGDVSKETGESWCPDCIKGMLLGNVGHINLTAKVRSTI